MLELEQDIPELKWARVTQRIRKVDKNIFGYQVRLFRNVLEQMRFICHNISSCVTEDLHAQQLECIYHRDDPNIIVFLKKQKELEETNQRFRAIAYDGPTEKTIYVFKSKGFAVCYGSPDNIRLNLSGAAWTEYKMAGIIDPFGDVKAVLDYLRGSREQQVAPEAVPAAEPVLPEID